MRSPGGGRLATSWVMGVVNLVGLGRSPQADLMDETREVFVRPLEAQPETRLLQTG
jgi:hypothetical protein